MADGDDAQRRPRDDRPGLEIVTDEHRRVVELGKMARDRIVELEHAAFEQSKETARDDGLGQRRAREDAADSERAVLADIATAERAIVDDPAVSANVERRTRYLAPFHSGSNEPIGFI